MTTSDSYIPDSHARDNTNRVPPLLYNQSLNSPLDCVCVRARLDGWVFTGLGLERFTKVICDYLPPQHNPDRGEAVAS